MAHKANDKELSFEESLKELEATVRNLEGGELTVTLWRGSKKPERQRRAA